MTKKTTILMRLCIFAAVFIFAAEGLLGEVVAMLSSPDTQVGRSVQLQYQFINIETPRDMPRSIMVDGLDIRLSGTSRRVEMVNMQTSSAIVYTYMVTPDRPGDFVIPGFAVQSGGQQIRTEDVELHVSGGGGGYTQQPQAGYPQQVIPQGRVPQQQQPPQGRRQVPRNRGNEAVPYFGELVLGSKTAYVGEVIPVELRYYFRADIGFDNLQRPIFGGEGFTAAPLSEPEQTMQDLEGVPYNVITFGSAITAVKSGEIEIPAASIEGRMMTSGGGGSGLDPFFDQFFQNFGMSGFGNVENFESRTRAQTLTVEALPKEGRPESFTGAIGQFTMVASASPKKVAAGEPVTLKAVIEGRGNFNGMGAPILSQEEGWRTYSPKEKFEPSDAIGFGGAKSFSFNMVAKTDRTETPGLEFSYFDPLKKKYVTLNVKPVAVTAAGASGVDRDGDSVAAKDAQTGSKSPEKDQKEAASVGASDISALADTLKQTPKSFVPLLLKPWFYVLQIVMLVALVVVVPVIAFLHYRKRKNAGRNAIKLQIQEAKVGMQQAKEPAAFYRAVEDYVRTQLASWDRCGVEEVDIEEALERRVSNEEEMQMLRSILRKSEESRYSGGGVSAIESGEREQIILALDKFSLSHV